MIASVNSEHLDRPPRSPVSVVPSLKLIKGSIVNDVMLVNREGRGKGIRLNERSSQKYKLDDCVQVGNKVP